MSDDDLLPGNATAFERAQSKTSARVLSTDVDAIRRERDPLHCDSQFLPPLAMERSIHHYTGTDEALDRLAVAMSFEDHIAYGTAAALEAEISLDIGREVRVVECFEDSSLEWPDFAVETLIDPGEAAPDLAAMQASALRRKNVRDWPHPRLRVRQPEAPLFIGAASSIGVTLRVLPEDVLPPPPQIYVGATTRVVLNVKVFPQ
ncbi:hypothetical protein IY145_10695 [Methylosinus sp. H3A]|uniref:phage tail protein n=1 Tax=Methylosinus sp. H3A TaxID=2785786 RepID=UPI0018C3017F|nr:phage tail protein [Methylosinus sp. H3A]MBG0809847.1 hypothetical protein [Methylosinus sp. H3A]